MTQGGRRDKQRDHLLGMGMSRRLLEREGRQRGPQSGGAEEHAKGVNEQHQFAVQAVP